MSSYSTGTGFGQTPPTMPGALPPALPAWPKVIGIISIVLGSLGVVGQGCGIAGAVAMPMMAAPMREAAKQAAAQAAAQGAAQGGGNAAAAQMEQQVAMFDAMGQYTPLLVGSGVLNIICAVLLIVAGIQLLKRLPSGRTLHLAYAGLRTVAVLFAIVPGWLMHVAQMEAMQASGMAMPPGLGAGFMTGMGVVGIVLGVVWGLAYPAFVVVWFMRGTIREQVAAWGQGWGPGFGPGGQPPRFGTV
ncbi:MAG: hypothetical protein MUE97_08120 [Phycisphaerales bacterium]|nr:hypothetical protein [Phycisphaerales bacterium]